MIGATCHYVTAELDADPIIAQERDHLDHTDPPGRHGPPRADIERTVLARGLMAHLQDRVLRDGLGRRVLAPRTVVF